jgi:hypothetical protein
MRVLLFLLVMPVWAQQVRLPFVGPPPAARQAPTQRFPRGLGFWSGGYWGGSWNSAPAQVPTPAPAPPAPVLVSSSLYQADRAQPVMREYGSLPAPTTASSPAAVVAFTDGRVEPVLAYWLKGEEFVYIAVGDIVRRVPLTSVDLGRSEGLNRQSGVVFRLK